MSIHHSTLKRAEKMGVILTEITGRPEHFPDAGNIAADEKLVQAFWPERNIYVFGADGKSALNQMEAAQQIKARYPDCQIVNDPADPFMIRAFDGPERNRTAHREPMLPDYLWSEVLIHEPEWLLTAVPEDGGEAYRAGFLAADNPFLDEDTQEDGTNERADKWDEEWDAAADEAEGEDDTPTGSVVSERYRQKYAEEGHPNHCGDWLAVLFIQLTTDSNGKINIERLDALCEANNVSLAKYKRTGNGWEGRLRMTGRNLVARRVWLLDGVLTLPASMAIDGNTTLRAPQEWLQTRPYKRPANAKAAA